VAWRARLGCREEGASRARVEAFGLSLVELVDRKAVEKSLLLVKPTMRVPHTGGERIVKGSTEEATLKAWVTRLAMLSGPELAHALEYRKKETAGHGVAPQAVLRRLTHSQYNNAVRDLLKDTTEPANGFPSEDYVNGFKNQYEALSVSPLLTEAYGLAAEK